MIFSLLFKDLVLRDKPLLFWVVLFPSVLYITYYFIFSGFGGASSFIVGVNVPYAFKIPMKKLFKIYEVKDEKSAVEGVKSGKYNSAILFKNGTFYIYHTSSTESLIVVDVLKAVIGTFGRKERKINVIFEEIPNKKEDLGSLYFINALVMVVLGVGFFGAIYTEEYLQSKKLKKLLKSIPEKYLPVDFYISLIHAICVFASLSVAFGAALIIHAKISYANALVAATVGSAIFIPMGMGLGKMSKKNSQLVANLCYFTLLFLSGAFFGVKININPATVITHIYRSGAFKLHYILWILLGIFVYYLGVKLDEKRT